MNEMISTCRYHLSEIEILRLKTTLTFQ